MRKLSIALVLCVAYAGLSDLAAATPTRYVIDLWAYPQMGDLHVIAPLAINGKGEVVGAQGGPDQQRGVIWRQGVITTIEAMGCPVAPIPGPGPSSHPFDINDLGQAVGGSYPCARPFLWEDGRLSTLTGLTGPASGRGINNLGQVIGIYGRSSPIYNRGFLWENGAVTDLGLLPGMGSLTPARINSSGEIVGTASTPAPGSFGASYKAFLWRTGTLSELASLNGQDTFAYDINDRHQIVGRSGYRPVLWENGTVRRLEGLEFGADVCAINNSGQIVGSTWSGGAFVWQDGVATDLNSLMSPESGWVLSRAMDINDAGDIVGYGVYKGTDHAFLLTTLHHTVEVDIKPDEASNTINLKSHGTIPVAIICSPDLPASGIDPDTIAFAGARPERYTIQDIDGDGDADLVLHVRVPDTNLSGESVEATLMGWTTDGRLFVGADAVRLVSVGN